MNEECLICKAPLEYLEAGEPMECAICRSVVTSATRCVRGHFVCNDCHTRGMDAVIGICLAEASKNPIDIIETIATARTKRMCLNAFILFVSVIVLHE